jgi:hypothetical protein
MNSGWKAVFDTSILIVIGYSCITTVFYVSFDTKISPTLKFIDYGVTFFFFCDFVFNFFQEYQDKETFMKIRDHKKIAVRYFKSGWMMLDFIATFPFDDIADVLYTRLIRLTRLSKMIALLDIGRVKRLIKSYFENSTRADRMQSQYIAMYTYKIFRLIVIVFLITYFIGCFWWLIVRYINNDKDIERSNTFIHSN